MYSICFKSFLGLGANLNPEVIEDACVHVVTRIQFSLVLAAATVHGV